MLQAKLEKISDTLRAWLKSGAYLNRAVEIYEKFVVTGRAYLSGLTFLGAGKPAVKGLSPVPAVFRADGEPLITVLFEQNNQPGKEPEMNEQEQKNLADRIIGWLKEHFTPLGLEAENKKELKMDSKEIEIQLKEKTAALEASEKKLAEVAGKCAALEAEKAALKTVESLASYKTALEKCQAENRITPAEARQYESLAIDLSEEKRNGLLKSLQEREPVLLFKELTAKGRKTPVSVSRTAVLRQGAEKQLRENPENESAAHAIKAFDLMDADGKISFTEASHRIREAEYLSA